MIVGTGFLLLGFLLIFLIFRMVDSVPGRELRRLKKLTPWHQEYRALTVDLNHYESLLDRAMAPLKQWHDIADLTPAYDVAYPLVTWQEVIDSLPPRIADALQATSPCPRYSARKQHTWEWAEYDIEVFGERRRVRSDNYWQCTLCGAVVDSPLYDDLRLAVQA